MASDGIIINLSDDQVHDAVASAIMGMFTEDMKKQVLEGAVKFLLEVPNTGGSYYNSDRRTRIQRAFDAAVDQMAYKVVQEYVEADTGFHEKMRELVLAQAANAILEDTRLRAAITRAIIQTIAEWEPPRG